MISLPALLVMASLQQSPQSPPIPADTYANQPTRTLIEQARGASARNGALITEYQTTVSQRMGVGLQAMARDRMLYRQEAVATISWRRDSTSTIEFVGAREGIPIAVRGDQVPGNLRSIGYDLVIDPAGDFLAGTGSDGEERLLNPLGVGAEQHYRYAIRDSLAITLNTGKTIRVFGVEILPRRADYNLMSGTLWFDDGSFNLVRAVYRPARPFESRRDAVQDDKNDLPGWVNVKFDVKFITIDYALFQTRWWMPRLIAFDGVGSMGAWLGVPFRLERHYDEYTVEGGTPPDPKSTFIPAGRRSRTLFSDPEPKDSAGKATRAISDSSLKVIVPADTASLLTSPRLGAPILEMGDLISESDLTKVESALKRLPSRPWETHVELPKTLGAFFRGARYNRVEALSFGTNAGIDFGRMALQAEGRIGLADLKPNGELSLRSASSHAGFALTGYRRLAVANPDTKPFSVVNSMLAVLAQRDDGEYYRTTGIEATATNINSGWWSVRFYHQTERVAEVETQAAIPHLFSNSQRFRPNFAADTANQTGGAISLRLSRPLSSKVRIGIEAAFDGATGDFDFGRMAYTLRTFYTPRTGANAALTLSAGTSTGTVPAQSAFMLGGTASLRGYPGGATRGTAYWLARGEVARGIPGARLSFFSDIGWAGPREDRTVGHALSSYGVGASFLDGLVRIDLAHALQASKTPQTRGSAWRLEFYFDGVL